jgi:hypothetical protein
MAAAVLPADAQRRDGPGAPGLVAREIQGLDVFGTDGQQVGKVTRVIVVADGVIEIEIRSRGFFGLFSKTYVIPADRLNKKGARLDLSMTSDQAMQFTK